MFKLRNWAFWGQWVPLPLRLIIGFGFTAHGWAKLSRGPSGFAKLLTQVGAPFPEATAWVSTFMELLGGLPIFVGAFVEIWSGLGCLDEHYPAAMRSRPSRSSTQK